MAKKEWKRAIVKALRAKGFTAGGAKKTAAKTIARSIAKKELLLNRRSDHAADWKKEMSVHQVRCSAGARAAQALHDAAAIHIPSTMAGKIVVIPPKAADE